jgi:hypothetical protein
MNQITPDVLGVLRQKTRPASSRSRTSLPLLAGEWVQVRSAPEILATLDQDGQLDGMPFMPEMLQQCGKTLRVFKRAHKTCDTIFQSGSRALEDAVHLEGSRCDGGAHGGCQAQCMLFWKEAWLKPLSEQVARKARPAAIGCELSDLQRAVDAASDPQKIDVPRYSCQATRLLSATKPLSGWDLRQYAADLRSGNIDVATLLRGTTYRFSAYAIRRTAWLGRYVTLSKHLSAAIMRAYDMLQAWLPDGVPYPRRWGSIPKGQRTPPGEDVRQFLPGSLVRVKSYEEILATLDTENKNRGLYFDAENVPYCGKELRVRSIVDHIIDEHTGAMIRFKTPAIILEGAYCRGTYSDKRMFCPRAVYPYWRSAWLTLLEAPSQSNNA